MLRAWQKAERRSSQTLPCWTGDAERLQRLGSVSSQMALKRDDEGCLPEPWAASLDKERVTRIFSVRMREVVVTESIVEDITCKNAK